MTLFHRLGKSLRRWVLFPFDVLTRLTSDSAVFILLILLCGLFSIGQNHWSNIPLLLSLVMGSLWLLALWQGGRVLRALHFRRTHPERIFANESLNVTIHLENRSRLPCAGIAIFETLENEPVQTQTQTTPAPSVVVASGGTFFTLVTGLGQERARYTIKIRRRGIYRFGPTRLETTFPLGFLKSMWVRQTPGRLIVYPQMGEVDLGFLEELELAIRQTHRTRFSRTEEDFRGLREYRHGDNPRWIHWRSSARTQRTLIKEFEEPQTRRVLLLIDTNVQRLGTQRFSALEMVVSFAASLARDLARRGYELECVALQPGNRVVRTVITSERRNLDSFLEMLAGLRRDDSRTFAHLKDYLRPQSIDRVYILALGLGSLRVKNGLHWLNSRNNIVKVIDARGDEFRRTFRSSNGQTAREQFREEDLLLDMNEASLMKESE